MIYNGDTIYDKPITINDLLKNVDYLANDWEDITSEFSIVSPFTATQTLKVVYSKSLSCIKFAGGGSFIQTSSISGFSWNAFLKYNGTKFTNANLFSMPTGYNSGITLFNSLDNNGVTNGYASIPNYFKDSGGFYRNFVFKLFMNQSNTCGIQFNNSVWSVS